ncbi:hypothetical protein J6590_063002 [Homalodisca vitripennis]|nr:hypothetical protein J6590_063002 [Homalodisca vitripennis]
MEGVPLKEFPLLDRTNPGITTTSFLRQLLKYERLQTFQGERELIRDGRVQNRDRNVWDVCGDVVDGRTRRGRHSAALGDSSDWQFKGSWEWGSLRLLWSNWWWFGSGDRNPGRSSRIGAIQPPQTINQQLRQKMLAALLQVYPMKREGNAADLLGQWGRPTHDALFKVSVDIALLNGGDIIGPRYHDTAAIRWRPSDVATGSRFAEAIHLRVTGHLPPHMANQTTDVAVPFNKD